MSVDEIGVAYKRTGTEEEGSSAGEAVARRDPDARAIARELYSAILAGRIPPGTKLGESQLASIFSVNRVRIKEALVRLACEQVVEMIPRQGAYVFRPTPKDAHDVFEARRLIEPFIIRKLAEISTSGNALCLREHVAREAEANQAGDREAVIRLSGEFHILMAKSLGNSALSRTMRRLAAMTCLVISRYGRVTEDSCRRDEHSAIVEAVTGGNGDLGTQLALEHLKHIEDSLEFDALSGDVNFEKLFGNKR